MSKFLKIPILAYHHVVDMQAMSESEIRNSPFTVSTQTFRRQLDWLARNGYRTLSLSQALAQQKDPGNGKIKRGVVITFDDGWHDNYEQAFPILTSFRSTATFFVTVGRIGEPGYATWEQLAEMQSYGMEIESHTYSHAPLELLSPSETEWELRQSKEFLEDQLGHRVAHISFPHGSYTKSVLKQAREVGYATCATSNLGYLNAASDSFQLPRIMIRQSENLTRFAKYCRADLCLMAHQRLLHGTKHALQRTIGLKRYMQLHQLVYKTARQSFTSQQCRAHENSVSFN